MQTSDLRIALFSGNYNYVRDGANQALNRLVGYLLKQGAAVRVYSPTTDTPAFSPTGDLVSVPSRALPGERSEYRAALRLPKSVRKDIEAFAPNIVHVSAPDFLGHAAVRFARKHHLPVVASAHTRFETYPRYYGLAFLEPVVTAILRRFYRRCDAVVAPSESFAQLLREQRMNYDIGIWSRGIDRDIFDPTRRDLGWRRALGIDDQEVVIGFLGRIVMEKGLDVFAETIDRLRARGVRYRVLVVGIGPAKDWFEQRLGNGVFVGFLMGDDLARAVASMDMLFNPSVTEAFGNVTLEAMACAVPVVAAIATGSESLIAEGVTGRLVRPGAIESFADAIQQLAEQPEARAAMANNALQEATRYSWDSINSAVAETYLRIIRQRAAGVAIEKRPAHG
jgi:phosphatidylinositol alpha 1,6-mannosyltransferase